MRRNPRRSRHPLAAEAGTSSYVTLAHRHMESRRPHGLGRARRAQMSLAGHVRTPALSQNKSTVDLMALLQVRPRRRGRLRDRLCRGFDRSDGHGSIRHRGEQLAVIGAQHAARGRCMRGHFGLCTSRRWRSRRHLFLCRTRTERHQRAVNARRRDTSPPRPNAVCRLPSMRLVSKAVRRRARLQRSRGPSPKGLPFPCSSCKAAQASGT